jgi:hypothetical protein
MILFRKAVGHNPRAEAFVCAPEGLQNSAQGFNPGHRSPRERRALKGRQIERPNKAEVGFDGPIVARPSCALLLLRRNRCDLNRVPASLAPSGRTVDFEVSQG